MGRPKKKGDDVVAGERFKRLGGTKSWTPSHWGAYVRGFQTVGSKQERGASRAGSDRLLDRADVMRLVPLSRAQIDRLERVGKFPQRVRLGDNRVAYSRREVMQWIEARKGERKVRRGGE